MTEASLVQGTVDAEALVRAAAFEAGSLLSKIPWGDHHNIEMEWSVGRGIPRRSNQCEIIVNGHSAAEGADYADDGVRSPRQFKGLARRHVAAIENALIWSRRMDSTRLHRRLDGILAFQRVLRDPIHPPLLRMIWFRRPKLHGDGNGMWHMISEFTLKVSTPR